MRRKRIQAVRVTPPTKDPSALGGKLAAPRLKTGTVAPTVGLRGPRVRLHS